MSTVNTLALICAQKAIADELKKRDGLEPGTYNVVDESVNVSMSGLCEVNVPEMFTPTVEIPLKVSLALFMRYSGITGQHALNALERAMTEALTLGVKGEKTIVECATLDKYEEKVKVMLGELPKKERKGKTLVKVKATAK
jgi:hypothetical protein